MADVKWIKISTGVFNDECFELIDDMPESDAIELIWFKLLVFAGKQNNNGLFLFKESLAYTDEMLASVFHRPINTVRLAMNTFKNLGMIEQIDGVYAIPNWDKYQNLDAYEQKKLRDKEYSKKYREKQKLLLEEKKQNKKTSDESSDDSRFCSYSISNSKSNFYSNKSNIDNLNYLLSINTDISDYMNNNSDLLEILKEWLEYKQDKGKQHLIYAKKSLGGLIDKFIMMDKQYGIDGVVYAIHETISNGWQGVVWTKADEFCRFTKNNQPKNSSQLEYLLNSIREDGNE